MFDLSQKGVFMWGKNYIQFPSISSIKNILKCKDKLTDKSICIFDNHSVPFWEKV